MLWLWIILPLMVVGVAVATVPVLTHSIREERRRKAIGYVTGERSVPGDGATRILAVLNISHNRPGEIERAVSELLIEPDGRVLTGAHVQHYAGEREVVVTIPAPTSASRRGTAARAVDHLRGSEMFESVRVAS